MIIKYGSKLLLGFVIYVLINFFNYKFSNVYIGYSYIRKCKGILFVKMFVYLLSMLENGFWYF